MESKRIRLGRISFILAILPYVVYFVGTYFENHNKVCKSYICTSTGSGIVLIYLVFLSLPVLIMSFLLAFATNELTISKIAIAIDTIPILYILLLRLGFI